MKPWTALCHWRLKWPVFGALMALELAFTVWGQWNSRGGYETLRMALGNFWRNL